MSGLIPGLHSNTIISIFSSFGLESEQLAFLIIALFPVHLIISFIPSIFFGIPEQQTVISILPGQRLVLDGKGLVALKVVLLASLLAALISIALFYPSLSFFQFVYATIRPYVGYILVIFSLIFLLRTKNPALSVFIFLLAGMLGFYSLNTKMQDSFLPLFSGMFAMAAILNYQKSKIPRQKDEKIEPDSNLLKFIFLGTIAGMFADLLPGISSPSQVAIFISIFLPVNTISYLATISSISMSSAIFSFATVASINKSRVGATASLDKIFNIEQNLTLILVLFLIAIAIAVAIVYLSRKLIAKLANIDFSKFNILLALYLFIIIAVLDGVIGIIIFALASALGFLTIKIGVERTNLMGAVIVPTILLVFKIFLI
ncbi:tripartite tricarboxylate transporter permease [Candidatus Micrarchaeota archaeon]|nr:tripartite tricarboxylate transporter permease [Candidatus Micrarchaeota archaeon]